MLAFLYFTGVNFENIFYGNSSSLYNTVAAAMVGIWILQITAYLTVLAFWKHNTAGKQLCEVIAPIFTIYPSEKGDYAKFINENDPARKAATTDKSNATDHLFLILYFALISVNCYFFTLMRW